MQRRAPLGCVLWSIFWHKQPFNERTLWYTWYTILGWFKKKNNLEYLGQTTQCERYRQWGKVWVDAVVIFFAVLNSVGWTIASGSWSPFGTQEKEKYGEYTGNNISSRNTSCIFCKIFITSLTSQYFAWTPHRNFYFALLDALKYAW